MLRGEARRKGSSFGWLTCQRSPAAAQAVGILTPLITSFRPDSHFESSSSEKLSKSENRLQSSHCSAVFWKLHISAGEAVQMSLCTDKRDAALWKIKAITTSSFAHNIQQHPSRLTCSFALNLLSADDALYFPIRLYRDITFLLTTRQNIWELCRL